MKLFLSIFILLFFALGAHAASFRIEPATGIYEVGKDIQIYIEVAAETHSVNAAEGIIEFNPDEIKIVSLNIESGAFPFWTTQPSFSNSSGIVRFGGGRAEPLAQTSGRIFSATIRGLRPAESNMRFFSGAILAADGKGTNVLEEMRGASYTFIPRSPQPQAESSTPSTGAPLAPIITSLTHPNEERWYSRPNVVLQWKTNNDVTGIRTSINHDPRSIPTSVREERLTDEALSGLGDGIWYYHLQQKNMFGWGAVAHFRIQIDTERPSAVAINEERRNDPTDPIVRLRPAARDLLSGISHYEIRIDASPAIEWKSTDPFATPPLPPGPHSFLVRAIDRAGNASAQNFETTIEPLPLPKITEFPSELLPNTTLVLRGNSFPGGTITITVLSSGETIESRDIPVNEYGDFTFVGEKQLPEGAYTISAEAKDSRGAISNQTPPVTVFVSQSPLLRIGTLAITALAVLVPLVALAFALLFIIWYGWHRFTRFRTRLRKEVGEAEMSMHAAFSELRGYIRKHRDILERTRSGTTRTKVEEIFLDDLEKDLMELEREVYQEMDDVEKEIR